jgi:hypothetical protein
MNDKLFRYFGAISLDDVDPTHWLVSATSLTGMTNTTYEQE